MQKKIKVYNTLSGKKDMLKPLKGRHINLFVCGPTVYDFSHLGHARTYVLFDAFVKYLKFLNYQVFYLQNITDIDDKIIQRAREKDVRAENLAEAFYQEYLKDMRALHVTSVTKYAKATHHIKEIIGQIQRLEEKGYAYRLDDGMYFNISKFKHYGKLSGRTALGAEDSISRIDYSKNKKNRGDFCLWKFAIKGEPSWASPFGAGRPGWHIEDTAITEKFFGAQYDVHGGGRDLIFPHHEAEITQMESASGKKPMARYWMHTGFLTIEGQKMSKSLNNFVLIGDFLKRYPYQYLRFFSLKSLWSSPIDYSESAMIEVKMSLEKIEELLRKLKSPAAAKALAGKQNTKAVKGLLKALQEEFYGNLDDDFNTPKAFAALFEFIKEINKILDDGPIDRSSAKKIHAFFQEINGIFDIIDFKKLTVSNVPQEVMELVKIREDYRKNTQWNKADETRQEIEKYGFLVDDTPNGPVVKKI